MTGDGLVPAVRQFKGIAEKADISVDADLDQHGRVQQGRDRGGRHAGVGQPGVQRHGGRLGEHAQQDQQHGRARDQGAAHGREVERPGLAVDEDEAQQHEHGAEERHQEGLVGLEHELPDPVEADQSPAGDGGDLPEQVHEDQVGREYQAHHGADEEQNDQVIFALVLFVTDVPQGIDDDQRAEKGGGDGHEHGEGVGDDDEVEAQGHGLAEGKLTLLSERRGSASWRRRWWRGRGAPTRTIGLSWR